MVVGTDVGGVGVREGWFGGFWWSGGFGFWVVIGVWNTYSRSDISNSV